MTKYLYKAIRRILRRAKKVILNSKKGNAPPSSNAPPAENIYDEVQLLRQSSLPSSVCLAPHSQQIEYPNIDVVKTVVELDRRLDRNRKSRSKIMESTEFSSSASSGNGNDHPIIVSHRSRLTQYIQREYFETISTNFNLSKVPAIKLNTRQFSYQKNGDHFRFRTSRPKPQPRSRGSYNSSKCSTADYNSSRYSSYNVPKRITYQL